MGLISLRCVVIAFVVAVTASATDASSLQDQDWLGYKATHGKVYSGREDMARRGVWESNMAFVRRHNMEADMGQHSYWMGENQYTDMTNQEFRSLMNGYVMSNRASTRSSVVFVANNKPFDDTVDWRTKGYVTEVKDQGQCGSCWAFSTTGSLEGQHFKKTGKLVSLSEQNLVDCSNLYGNRGCQGGEMDNAFKYIKANKGIDTERSYGYVARTNLFCHYKEWSWDIGATLKSFVDVQQGSEKALAQAVSTVGPISIAMDAGHDSFQVKGQNQGVNEYLAIGSDKGWSWDIGATLKSFVDVQQGSEKALAQAVSTVGPISIAMDAGHDSFQHYSTGIYQEPACSSTQLDHGVLVVGYGSEGNQNYWIIKNSWGSSWGERGYFKMLKDHNNMCGPATTASYPVV